MVFVVGHFATEQDMIMVASLYEQQYGEVIICGTTSFDAPKNFNIPYHPLMRVSNEKTTVIAQHAYIDLMLRAIQIEVPEKLILHQSSKMDTPTVISRIVDHAKIVGVEVVQL